MAGFGGVRSIGIKTLQCQILRQRGVDLVFPDRCGAVWVKMYICTCNLALEFEWPGWARD